MEETLPVDPVVIRYDGLDADDHEIELSALADSLKGLSRIIGVTANYAATERYVQHKDALSVRVVARAPEAHCYEMLAVVKWAADQPLIAGTLATLSATLITYVVKRAARQREEMKHLKGALETAIKELGHRDQAVIDRMLGTIDKMADALRPAAKQAVAPIGETVQSLSIGDGKGGVATTIGTAEREAIMADEPVEVTPEQTYHVVLSEVDITTGACKVAFSDDLGTRISGVITDPSIAVPHNAYVLALAAMKAISVRAKATVRDGSIDRLHISDTA